MRKHYLSIFIVIVIIAVGAGFYDYPSLWDKGADAATRGIQNVSWLKDVSIPHFWNKPYVLGLDVAGGAHLEYQADLSSVPAADQDSTMSGLKDVIERRVNVFGVSEPRVETQKIGNSWRLIVEIAGINDISAAIQAIGQTPYLEFREENAQAAAASSTDSLSADAFEPTALTGKYLTRASLDFDKTTFQPTVQLQFNSEGAKLFGDITARNVGRRVAIAIDGNIISAPVVQEKISGGTAVISGNFTLDEAKKLAANLNAGALPVPITLIAQQTVGASLGASALQHSVKAGAIGLLIVFAFMILYYGTLGFFASLALLIYTALVLAIFKTIPVTLTLAGIAGFVLSIGMAVDANILIFERIKEERKRGRTGAQAIEEGFRRAWTSIRDSNVSTIITSLVLYTFTTSIVQGFALTLLIGVLVSMFTAITVTRSMLRIFLKS
ncbi:MAG: protein translocase subunit SecD [Patescibacteria group bacterium]|nr:protein translocase subunit SecD [Patescibacteria group bacterium]MDE2438310.1 protein translocase subunit SecD [Patescibacteria group bacterium]